MTDEPGGQYLWHIPPEEAIYSEKPALKTAEALYDFLQAHDILESLMVLGGDITFSNTGWWGEKHVLLEKLLGRKLFWAICTLHTNELPLRHLILSVDGPTTSDTVFLVLSAAYFQKLRP